MNIREIFFSHLTQTSPFPMLGEEIDIVRASGSVLYDRRGKEYIDFISGISVSCVGHCHPAVVRAVQQQAERFMHLMVYGEFIQEPQIRYASELMQILPSSLSSLYYTTGGSEAIELAIKVARKFTGKTKLITFKNSYHGSTLGALSLSSLEEHLNAYAPLIPGVMRFPYGSEEWMNTSGKEIAAVIMEPVQAESGIVRCGKEYYQKIREWCNQNGVLLVFDEIQTGFGRTGEWFAFMQYDIVPDILCIAKGMGGGVPIGACVADRKIMSVLTNHPILGHMNTFGGNALACEAARATLQIIREEKLCHRARWIEQKIKEFFEKAAFPDVKLHTAGAWAALHFADEKTAWEVCRDCIRSGVITDWFLYNSSAIRIAPPLTIPENILMQALDIIASVIKKHVHA